MGAGVRMHACTHVCTCQMKMDFASAINIINKYIIVYSLAIVDAAAAAVVIALVGIVVCLTMRAISLTTVLAPNTNRNHYYCIV